MSVPVVIALGGNLGDVRATGESALAQLRETPGVEVEQVSDWYSTEPVGCEGGFLNAAARLQCELTPSQLLKRMSEIETQLGRLRTGHWTPRPIDLDLILFGQWQIVHPQLKVPHPAAWSRRFVLDPVCAVAGQMIHPGFAMTLEALRARLLTRPLPVSWAGELPRDAVVTGEIQDRFGPQVSWVDPQADHVARIVPMSDSGLRPFDIPVPNDLAEARRIINDMFTAMLDEPFIV